MFETYHPKHRKPILQLMHWNVMYKISCVPVSVVSSEKVSSEKKKSVWDKVCHVRVLEIYLQELLDHRCAELCLCKAVGLVILLWFSWSL